MLLHVFQLLGLGSKSLTDQLDLESKAALAATCRALRDRVAPLVPSLPGITRAQFLILKGERACEAASWVFGRAEAGAALCAIVKDGPTRHTWRQLDALRRMGPDHTLPIWQWDFADEQLNVLLLARSAAEAVLASPDAYGTSSVVAALRAMEQVLHQAAGVCDPTLLARALESECETRAAWACRVACIQYCNVLPQSWELLYASLKRLLRRTRRSHVVAVVMLPALLVFARSNTCTTGEFASDASRHLNIMEDVVAACRRMYTDYLWLPTLIGALDYINDMRTLADFTGERGFRAGGANLLAEDGALGSLMLKASTDAWDPEVQDALAEFEAPESASIQRYAHANISYVCHTESWEASVTELGRDAFRRFTVQELPPPPFWRRADYNHVDDWSLRGGPCEWCGLRNDRIDTAFGAWLDTGSIGMINTCHGHCQGFEAGEGVEHLYEPQETDGAGSSACYAIGGRQFFMFAWYAEPS